MTSFRYALAKCAPLLPRPCARNRRVRNTSRYPGIGWRFTPIPNAQVTAETGGQYDHKIVVFCRSGVRSGIAKEYLLAQGYESVANCGYPTTSQNRCILS